ncbi:MAG: hypothetical protein QGH40_02455 [bacterium]|nr:hypothetical protein [bacterium]
MRSGNVMTKVVIKLTLKTSLLLVMLTVIAVFIMISPIEGCTTVIIGRERSETGDLPPKNRSSFYVRLEPGSKMGGKNKWAGNVSPSRISSTSCVKLRS